MVERCGCGVAVKVGETVVVCVEGWDVVVAVGVIGLNDSLLGVQEASAVNRIAIETKRRMNPFRRRTCR